MLRAIYDRFKLDEFAGELYELTDLMAIKIKADSPSPKQLEWFMTSWESTLAGVKTEPTDDVLEALFIERIRGCPGIAQDIGLYDRARAGESERSYAFLYESVTRFLERRRRNENRKAIQTALANSTGGKSQPQLLRLVRMLRNEAKVEVRLVRGLRPRPLVVPRPLKAVACIGYDPRVKTQQVFVTSGRTRANVMAKTMELASMLTLPIRKAREVAEKVRRVGKVVKVEAEAKVEREAEVLHRPVIRRSLTFFVLST